MIELPDRPPVEMPAREAARRRFALDGANAQALEGALSGVERLLRDLLAAIHGDGGQHEQRHGLEESCRQAHARIADLRRALDAAKSAPTAGASDLWYSYDPEEGYDTWSTAQEAENAAATALEHFRDQSTDGWHMDVGGISWGRLVAYAYATKCDEQPTEPGSAFDYTCDYVLETIR